MRQNEQFRRVVATLFAVTHRVSVWQISLSARHICDEWTFVVVGPLIGLLQEHSQKLGNRVRKPPVYRLSPITSCSVREPVAIHDYRGFGPRLGSA
jgi:hypothetical protein